ncbi:MAG: hypothetical protein AB8B85_06420 [Paracoccaceae bacterium]
MSDQYERFSIAWVPVPGTALADFGALWTGWCSARGEYSPLDPSFASARDAARVERFPGSRGLHAPLTQPFRLIDGVSRWALEDKLEKFAARQPSAYVAEPVIDIINERVMLVPGEQSRILNAMMQELQSEIAPLAEFDAGPMPRQFGLPLTGVVGPTVADRVIDAVSGPLDGIVGSNPLIASLSLMADPGDGQPWCMLYRYVLSDQSDSSPHFPSGMACLGPYLLTPGISMMAEGFQPPNPEPV